MATLTKLTKTGKVLINDSYITYPINVSIKCGDGYKDGLNHRFEGSENQVDVLIKIIKKLKIVTLSNITDKSFDFSSKFNGPQIFIFRICRYVRFKGLLEFILELNTKDKIPMHTAILIGVLYKRHRSELTYYNSNRDIISSSYCKVNWSFPTAKSFRENITRNSVAYYNIYLIDGNNSINSSMGIKTRKPNDYVKTYRRYNELLNSGNFKSIARLLSKRLY